MNGNEQQMDMPKRLDITSGQLTTAVHILEALANKQFIQRHLPGIGVIEPKTLALFVSDLIVKAKNENQLYIDSGDDDGFEIEAGEYFTILNQNQAKVRLSFFDDNNYNGFAKTSQQLQLPNQGGIPVLILEPGKEGAVTTLVVAGGGLKSVWINIEMKGANGAWDPVGPGGNGANMKINNP